MKPSFEQQRVPVVAHATLPERSRSLSIFVGLAHQRLPALFRYEGTLGAILTLVGLGIAAVVLLQGWWGLILCLVGALWWLISFGPIRKTPDDITRLQRIRAIQFLDRLRRSVGLDEAIEAGPLSVMEQASQHWERLDNVLQAKAWEPHGDLRQLLEDEAHLAMEEIVVLELGASGDGVSQSDRRVARRIAGLKALAEQAETVTNLMDSYPRNEFDANGAPLPEIIPEVAALRETLDRLRE